MIDAAKVDALAAIEVFTGLETRYPGALRWRRSDNES